jgi:hypothetical protein
LLDKWCRIAPAGNLGASPALQDSNPAGSPRVSLGITIKTSQTSPFSKCPRVYSTAFVGFEAVFLEILRWIYSNIIPGKA